MQPTANPVASHYDRIIELDELVGEPIMVMNVDSVRILRPTPLSLNLNDYFCRDMLLSQNRLKT